MPTGIRNGIQIREHEFIEAALADYPDLIRDLFKQIYSPI